MPPAPVPVTLVTGFLGAGKSSLVAHVLHNKQGRRVAVVVNEFGAGLGLESALVPDADRCLELSRTACPAGEPARDSPGRGRTVTRWWRSLWSCPTAASAAL